MSLQHIPQLQISNYIISSLKQWIKRCKKQHLNKTKNHFIFYPFQNNHVFFVDNRKINAYITWQIWLFDLIRHLFALASKALEIWLPIEKKCYVCSKSSKQLFSNVFRKTVPFELRKSSWKRRHPADLLKENSPPTFCFHGWLLLSLAGYESKGTRQRVTSSFYFLAVFNKVPKELRANSTMQKILKRVKLKDNWLLWTLRSAFRKKESNTINCIGNFH